MTVRLRDGSRVLIRAIEPDDRAALAEAFERLSDESRYRRFFAPMRELRPTDLDHLTRTVVETLWPRRRAPGEPARNAIVVGTDGSGHARDR